MEADWRKILVSKLFHLHTYPHSAISIWVEEKKVYDNCKQSVVLVDCVPSNFEPFPLFLHLQDMK